MADLRIHELTDTQAAYDPDICVAADDSTFTNTKKMPIDAIYPKTNTLTDPGAVNPDTTLLRLDNGSGVENKRSITDVLNDSGYLNNSASLTFSGTPDSNWSGVSINGKSLGNVLFITSTFTATNSNIGNAKYFKTIDNYISPGFTVYFTVNPTTAVIEQGNGYINTNGDIYIVAGKGDSQQWVFHVTLVG